MGQARRSCNQATMATSHCAFATEVCALGEQEFLALHATSAHGQVDLCSVHSAKVCPIDNCKCMNPCQEEWLLQIALGNISETTCAPSARNLTDAQDGEAAGDLQQGNACSWNACKSGRITWDMVAAADPDVLVVACCGFDFLRNCADGQAALSQHAQARSLRAVQSGNVFAVDGNRCGHACTACERAYMHLCCLNSNLGRSKLRSFEPGL